MGLKIEEKPTAVAAAPNWYVVKLSLQLRAGDAGYEDLLARAGPGDVELRLRPVVAWRIDFRRRDPSAPVDRDTDDEWPGLDMASPITIEGDERPWGDSILKTPDGLFTQSQVQDWPDEDALRAWFLAKARRVASGDDGLSNLTLQLTDLHGTP